jgi:hypothetical protein
MHINDLNDQHVTTLSQKASSCSHKNMLIPLFIDFLGTCLSDRFVGPHVRIYHNVTMQLNSKSVIKSYCLQVTLWSCVGRNSLFLHCAYKPIRKRCRLHKPPGEKQTK